MTDARNALKYVHELKYSSQHAEPNPPTSSTSVKDISVRRSAQSKVTCRLRRHLQTVLDITAEAGVKRAWTTSACLTLNKRSTVTGFSLQKHLTTGHVTVSRSALTRASCSGIHSSALFATSTTPWTLQLPVPPLPLHVTVNAVCVGF